MQPIPQQDQAMQHHYTQNRSITSSTELGRHILQVRNDGVKTFFCGWPECKHPVGFETKPRAITHIRSAHLREKPFICLTWWVFSGNGFHSSEAELSPTAMPLSPENKMLIDMQLR